MESTGPGPFMTGQVLPLKTEEVLKILQSIDHDRCVTTMPFHPKGGEVYIYKPLEAKNRLYWRDGYVWKNQGLNRLPSKNPSLEKRYYHIVLQDGQADLTICRHCYCQDAEYDPDGLTLVHYIGNLGHEPAIQEQTLAEEPRAENGDVNGQTVEIGEQTEQATIDTTDQTAAQTVQMGELVTSQETKKVTSVDKTTNNDSAIQASEVDPTNTETTQNGTESSSPATPDLTSAMATMKAVLEANKADTPMMEMFSKLMESMTPGKPEMEYTLVVSDVTSGHSSMFGSEKGKEIVGKSPQILKKLGKRRRSGGVSGSDADDEEPLPKITRSRMREKTPDKVDNKAASVKKRGRPRLSKSELQNKQSDIVECVREIGTPKVQLKSIPGKRKTPISNGRKECKMPSKIVNDKSKKSPENTLRSSSRTRKIDSPNWRAILSGRKSIISEGRIEKSTDKSNKMLGNKISNNLRDSAIDTHLNEGLCNDYGLPVCSIKLENVDESFSEPSECSHPKRSGEKTADKADKSASLSEHVDVVRKRGRPRKLSLVEKEKEMEATKNGKNKQIDISVAYKGQNNQKHLTNKTPKVAYKQKAANNHTPPNKDQSSNSERRSKRRITCSRKYEDFEIDTRIIKHAQPNDPPSKTLSTKKIASPASTSIKTDTSRSSKKTVSSPKNLPKTQRKVSQISSTNTEISKSKEKKSPIKKVGSRQKPKISGTDNENTTKHKKVNIADKLVESDSVSETSDIGDGDNDIDWTEEFEDKVGKRHSKQTAGFKKERTTDKAASGRKRRKDTKVVPKCPLCQDGFIYTDRRDMEQHMLLIHKQKLEDVESRQKELAGMKGELGLTFECHECQIIFDTSTELSYHNRVLHKIDYGPFMYFGFVKENGKYCCEICEASFDSFDKYLDHRIDHLRFPFLCRICGHGFYHTEQYVEHTNADCSIKFNHLSCGMCELKFLSCDTRRKHVTNVHPKTTAFSCHHCGICFNGIGELRDHFPVHIDDKIYKCEYCDKSTLEKRRLIDHRLRHRPTKSVLCPGCYKYFNSEKSMERHRRCRCKNGGKFECLHCHKMFSLQEDLINHEEIHIQNDMAGSYDTDNNNLMTIQQDHQEKKAHNCPFCELTFLAATELFRHKKSAHKSMEAKISIEVKKNFIAQIKKDGAMWKCDACGFSSAFKGRLKRHMEVHEEEKQFECEFCKKKFQTYSMLSTHRIIHRSMIGKHGKGKIRSFHCRWENCSSSFPKRAKLKRHLSSHLFKVWRGREKCECIYCLDPKSEECVMVVSGEVVLDGLVQSLTNETAVTDSSELATVQQAVRNNEETLIVVEPLEIASMGLPHETISEAEHVEDKSELEGHSKKAVLWPSNIQVVDTNSGANETENHKMDEENDNATEANHVIPSIGEECGDETSVYFECPLCDKQFATKCKVLEHNEISHADFTYPTCDVCKKAFPDAKNLMDHKSVHTGEMPWECKDCGRRFRTKTSWTQHCNIHKKIKPFYCSICGHGFTQKGYFDQHVKRHMGDLPFECDICRKRFVSKDCRKRHMYVHTGNKPRVCEECGKSYVDLTALKIHKRTHTNERPFSCQRCGKAFYTNAKLTRHLKTVHGLNLAMISDYTSTKCGAGVGWRRRSKLQNGEHTQPQIVYIDKDGNVISRENNPDVGSVELNVEDTTTNVTSEMDDEGPVHAKTEHSVTVASQTSDDSLSSHDNNKYVVSEQGLKVITTRKASGQLQVDAIGVPEEIGPHVSIAEDNNVPVPVTNMQIIGNNIVQNENSFGISPTERQTSNTQHLELIAQALVSHGVSTETIHVDGLKGDNIQTHSDEIYGQHEPLQTENFSINISEDGTVDPADLEALRNMYNDQPIVIVLESQSQ